MKFFYKVDIKNQREYKELIEASSEKITMLNHVFNDDCLEDLSLDNIELKKNKEEIK